MFAASRIQTRAFSATARDVRSPIDLCNLLLTNPEIRRGSNPFALDAQLLTSQQLSKVTVLGAAGGIGQPLSLLLKLNPRVTELALYDVRGGPGTFHIRKQSFP